MGHNFLSDAKTIPMLLLLYFSIVNLLNLVSAHPPYKFCSNTSLYAAHSPFENNLQTLMSYLASNASVSKQYHAYAGNDPDIVYAQYMCYNYITNENCRACIDAASRDIMQLCPNKRDATVWEELCQLRFSNKIFIGELDFSGNIPLYNRKAMENSVQFVPVLNEKFCILSKKAAFDPVQNMYATGKLALPDLDTLYALGQCTTYLSSHDCNTCLQVAIQNILSFWFIGRRARLLSRNCYFRYEFYAFFESATVSETQKGKEWTILKTVLGTSIPIVVLAFLTASCIIYFRRIRRKETDEEKNHRSFFQELRKSRGSTFAEGNKGSSDELPRMMDLSAIRAATDNFSVSNKLGQGGFGPVYKVNNSLCLQRTCIQLKVWQLWNEGRGEELMDRNIVDSCPISGALRWIHIALLCVQDDPARRPTMSLVVLMLGSNAVNLPQPSAGPNSLVKFTSILSHQSSATLSGSIFLASDQSTTSVSL
ncbi:hypothetical protein DKX38_016937 [Salix brachista]|uniref:Gnk2-homologous domain-containing protein n=1 Tax=Salix brachista TaxID=2182728 RepID=A0A5N5KUR1_9ROSI|nr:hypothetical protein DKX38_016937 [Salix brachista]